VAGAVLADLGPEGPPAQSLVGAPPFREGIWISQAEIELLPTSGAAWHHVRSMAERSSGEPNLADQDQNDNVFTLAKALVFARTGYPEYREDVRASCMAAIDTELGGRTLSLGRELAAYVIAAEIVGLEPDEDRRFRAWLRRALTEDLHGRTLRSTHEDRPNNWGTHAGASRAAVAVFLQDRAELERVARVFRGWLGDRHAYADFEYGSLTWQANEESPVGINPVGAEKLGEDISGALPDDMRRGGEFRVPPSPTNYPWEALQGAVVQAEILHRQGFDAWEWEDRALLRAVQYLYDLDRRFPNAGWWAHGDDEWIIWLINRRYGTSFPAQSPAASGKNMGWTDWTHGGLEG
jgi:hypothetical protein